MAALTPTQAPTWQQSVEQFLIQSAMAPLLEQNLKDDPILRSELSQHICCGLNLKYWCFEKCGQQNLPSLDKIEALFETALKKYIQEIVTKQIYVKNEAMSTFKKLEVRDLTLPKEKRLFPNEEPPSTLLAAEIQLLDTWNQNPDFIYQKIPDLLKNKAIKLLKAVVTFTQALN